jgi:hypothetical protein
MAMSNLWLTILPKRGIQKPFIVRPVGDLYQAICGLARWKGALIAGLVLCRSTFGS